MPHKGYFVIADVTGYTAFMTGSELDHAQDILRTLFETLHDGIRPPLIISNYQGDAILTYAAEGSVLQGQTLLELIENIYYLFARKLEQMHRNTTCTCNACRNIPNLDLKLFAHYGEYVIQDMRGKQELSGPDVIVVHRMMKNEVKEKTGKKAYVLLTEAAARAMRLEEYCRAEMIPHSESYEHIGKVQMYVHCLKTVWAREHEKRRVVADPQNLWLNIETDIPAPPAVVWDYLNEPDHKRRWMGAAGVSGLRITDLKKGRVDVGTFNHCAHGKDEIAMQIVDWRPFEYFTMETHMPMNGIMRDTYRLTPIEGGTRVSLMTSLHAEKPLNRLAVKALMALMKRSFARHTRAAAAELCCMVEEESASGKLVTAPAAGAAQTGA